MKNVAKVEVGEVGDNIVITIPKSLVSDGILDPELEYEAVIVPKETFNKEFKVAMSNLSSKKDNKSPLESEEMGS